MEKRGRVVCNLIDHDIYQPPQLTRVRPIGRVESGSTTSSWLIEEKENDGKMKLFVEVKGQCSPYFYLKDNFFVILENKCQADGVIWEYVNNTCCRLHLFELKKKISISNWNKARTQYHGTLLRCQIVADLLGVKILPCIHLYTVYHQEDNIDPAMTRIPTNWLPSAAEQEWEQNCCDLNPLGWPPNWGQLTFHHHKVHLNKLNSNNIPEGTYDLQSSCINP